MQFNIDIWNLFINLQIIYPRKGHIRTSWSPKKRYLQKQGELSPNRWEVLQLPLEGHLRVDVCLRFNVLVRPIPPDLFGGREPMYKLDHWEDWAPDTPPTTTPPSTPRTSPRTTVLVPSPHLMSGQNMTMVDVETNGTIREVLALVGVITCVIIWTASMRLVKWGRRKVRYCFSNFFK